MNKPFTNDYQEQCNLIDPDKPVRVYRNLHKKCWSVKQGVVRFHCHKIFLKNVKFLVNERLRQKVVAERRKNVHAFVYGELIAPLSHFPTDYSTNGVYYNPYKHSMFVCGDKPIDHAYICELFKDGEIMRTVVDPNSAFHARILNQPLDTHETCDTMMETVETHLL